MISAKYSEIVIVVVNGSPTPKTAGLSPGAVLGTRATSAFSAGISGSSAERVGSGRPLPGWVRACSAFSVSCATFSSPCWASSA